MTAAAGVTHRMSMTARAAHRSEARSCHGLDDRSDRWKRRRPWTARSIRYDHDELRLRVRDDRRGIDSAVLAPQGSKGHFGLPGMTERATLIGGSLAVWSEGDAGTEVERRVPTSAYARLERRRWLSQGAGSVRSG